MLPANIAELQDNFSLFDDWEDRYRYVIELGRELTPMDDALKTPETKVEGCTSQVWFVRQRQDDGTLTFIGDSDAHIVRGLIAILFVIYGGKTPDDILAIDARAVLGDLGLDQHLSPSRTNGLFAMVGRIRAFAEEG
ncbi:MAG: SufE family protein [Alphaproteobacteria bacterium]